MLESDIRAVARFQRLQRRARFFLAHLHLRAASEPLACLAPVCYLSA